MKKARSVWICAYQNSFRKYCLVLASLTTLPPPKAHLDLLQIPADNFYRLPPNICKEILKPVANFWVQPHSSEHIWTSPGSCLEIATLADVRPTLGPRYSSQIPERNFRTRSKRILASADSFGPPQKVQTFRENFPLQPNGFRIQRAAVGHLRTALEPTDIFRTPKDSF